MLHAGLRIGAAIMGNELVTYFLDKHLSWGGGGGGRGGMETKANYE